MGIEPPPMKPISAGVSSAKADKTPALTDEQLQDKDYLRQLAIGELAAIVKANGGKPIGTNACNSLLDRVDGKPAQTVHQTNETTINIAVSERRQRVRQEVQSALDALLIESVPLTIGNE